MPTFTTEKTVSLEIQEFHLEIIQHALLNLKLDLERNSGSKALINEITELELDLFNQTNNHL